MNILIPILLLCIAFAGIAIKILLKKDGKFAGTTLVIILCFKMKRVSVVFVEQNQTKTVNLRWRENSIL